MGPTCNGNPETTVFAHLNGAAFGKGKGQKAHDIAGSTPASIATRTSTSGTAPSR